MKKKIIYSLLLCALSTTTLAAENPYFLAIQQENSGNYTLAIEQYQTAANSGFSDAKFALGRLYRDVYGDMPKSFEWFLDAANQGNSFAQYEVGMIYKTGNAAVLPNRELAVNWLTKAASKRHKDAAYQLFELGATGQNEWLEKAAKLGHIKAMRVLSNAYQNGTYGFPVDRALSESWATQATQAEE